jgi:hypothetical protein
MDEAAATAAAMTPAAVRLTDATRRFTSPRRKRPPGTMSSRHLIR